MNVTRPVCSSMEEFLANTKGYRFGFNGKEGVSEINGEGNEYDFGSRVLSARLGRWFKQDPLFKLYPPYSPYCFALNSPIQAKDVDGRLVIYSNGLRFTSSLWHGLSRLASGFLGYLSTPKLGDNPEFENGEGVYRNFSEIEGGENYWKASDGSFDLINEFNTLFNDENNVYVDGTNRWYSGEVRYKEGEEAAMTLDKMIKAGKVVLQPGETIKIVGHSQGARYAAGMAAKLIEMGYPVEQVWYLGPHQPKKIKHPSGAVGYQASRATDGIIAKGFIPTFISRSRFGKIPSSMVWLNQLPNIRGFFSNGYRGHDASYYSKDFFPKGGGGSSGGNKPEAPPVILSPRYL